MEKRLEVEDSHLSCFLCLDCNPWENFDDW